MNPIDPHTARKALASYFKGLVQDYYYETGQKVTSVLINAKIEGCKWKVINVDIVTDKETPMFEDFT